MNRITLTHDGKNLFDAKGNQYNMQDVLAGSLGRVHAMEISVIVDAPDAGKSPAVAFRNKPTTKQEKAAGDAAAKAMKQANEPKPVKAITKGSKVDQMFQMMLRKNGATFEEIQKKFGWSDGGTGSYVYFYPKDSGYSVEKIIRPNGDKAYKLVLPEGAKAVLYK